MYYFPYLKPVHCCRSGSNCCFLTCIQVLQEAGKVIWYSHLFKNFPQFVVIHTVKGFNVVNEAYLFLEFSCLFYDPMDVGNLISVFSLSAIKWCKWIKLSNQKTEIGRMDKNSWSHRSHLQEPHLRSKDRNRRKVKEHKKILHTNSNQKRAGVATLTTDKTD